MKFKIATIGLLIAILSTCIFASYKLITETKQQTEILTLLGEAEMDRGYYEIKNIDIENYKPYVENRNEQFAKIIYKTK